MIWCRYVQKDAPRDGSPRFGLVEGDVVLDVDGDPFDVHRPTGDRHDLDTVRLLTPVTPANFYCAGSNYVDHIRYYFEKQGKPAVIPQRAELGYRSPSALIAHDEDIVKPADAGEAFQYEGELVAVIGRRAKRLTRETALDCVLGWTIGNDVSERTWQREDRTFWRSKNADTFKPMGPWIATDPDLDAMVTTVRLNGEETDRFRTAGMLFTATDFLVELTRYVTLHPGDVLWLGTDGAPRNMAPGDVVEVEISGIGSLRNRVVAEA